VRSGPAELFLALDLVVMTSPDGRTAVKLKTAPFLMVPYLYRFRLLKKAEEKEEDE